MTEKEVYENVLREVRKAKAPSLHLEDFNYWATKGVQEYTNERYSKFQISQQLTDDLQALVVPTTFTITQTGPNTYTGSFSGDYTSGPIVVTTGNRYDSDYFRFHCPDNYWHILGSHVGTILKRQYKCYSSGYKTSMPAKKLTQDIANGIINNAFLKPLFNRPYYEFINGPNQKPDLLYFVGDKTKFGITDIAIDYLREPRKINLTVTQRDLPIDSSAVMEFPEYVCNEIIKRIVKMILESTSDPRIKTQPVINAPIA